MSVIIKEDGVLKMFVKGVIFISYRLIMSLSID